jgi:hypothetical protein
MEILGTCEYQHHATAGFAKALYSLLQVLYNWGEVLYDFCIHPIASIDHIARASPALLVIVLPLPAAHAEARCVELGSIARLSTPSSGVSWRAALRLPDCAG